VSLGQAVVSTEYLVEGNSSVLRWVGRRQFLAIHVRVSVNDDRIDFFCSQKKRESTIPCLLE